MNVGKEQLLRIELHPVRDTDVAHVPAGPGGTDRLLHRHRRADAFHHRVGADAFRQLLDPSDALVLAFAHDVGRSEVERELLTRLVSAHRDDPLRAHLCGREDGKDTYRTVTDDDDRFAGFYVRGIGREPTGAED